MIKNGSFLQGYNCQAVADAEQQIIVAQATTNQSPDAGHFVPVLDQIQANLAMLPTELSADCGYCSEANIDHAAHRGVDAYIATERTKGGGRDRSSPSDADPENPGAVCRSSAASGVGRSQSIHGFSPGCGEVRVENGKQPPSPLCDPVLAPRVGGNSWNASLLANEVGIMVT
ncbi:transposase [Planctomycetota bacterium]